MKRSKQILVTSHCILNQNAVINCEARAKGAVLPVVNWALEAGYGIYQLPCPEMGFLGVNRPSQTKAQYDTPDYRMYCRQLLQPVVAQLKDYQQNGYTLAGAVGIQSSPTCDPENGIYYEELRKLLMEEGVVIQTYWQLPDDAEARFDPETDIRTVKP